MTTYIGKEIISECYQEEVNTKIKRLKTKGATRIRYSTTEVYHDWGSSIKACILGYK